MCNYIDHIDAVITHYCNFNCPFCIDKFKTSIKNPQNEFDKEYFNDFLNSLNKKESSGDIKINPNREVLFLGGEPTTVGFNLLKDYANIVSRNGFHPIISTNGVDKSTIKKILPYFDWVQVTAHSKKEIDEWRTYNTYGNINLKIAGNSHFTYDKLNYLIDNCKDFTRRSVSMYFTKDFVELCKDKEVWNLLDSLNSWKINGSYEYAFYKDVRIKKCIHGLTNIIDEPTVPKIYDKKYNKTWDNEELDDYLNLFI